MPAVTQLCRPPHWPITQISKKTDCATVDDAYRTRRGRQIREVDEKAEGETEVTTGRFDGDHLLLVDTNVVLTASDNVDPEGAHERTFDGELINTIVPAIGDINVPSRYPTSTVAIDSNPTSRFALTGTGAVWSAEFTQFHLDRSLSGSGKDQDDENRKEANNNA
jgi:hypothetical protein